MPPTRGQAKAAVPHTTTPSAPAASPLEIPVSDALVSDQLGGCNPAAGRPGRAGCWYSHSRKKTLASPSSLPSSQGCSASSVREVRHKQTLLAGSCTSPGHRNTCVQTAAPPGPPAPAEFCRVKTSPHQGCSLCPGRTRGSHQSSGQPHIKTHPGFCIVLLTHGHGDHRASCFTNPSCRRVGPGAAPLLTQPQPRPATSSLISPPPALYGCIYLFNNMLVQPLKAESTFSDRLNCPANFS